MGKIKLGMVLFFLLLQLQWFPYRIPFNGKTETILLTAKIQLESYV